VIPSLAIVRANVSSIFDALDWRSKETLIPRFSKYAQKYLRINIVSFWKILGSQPDIAILI